MIRVHPESRGLLTGEHIAQYVYGGRGIVTLASPSGKHHSYLFSKPRNEDVFPEDVLFVYAVHEQKLFYVGMVENNMFRLTMHSRFDRSTEIVRGAYYIMNMVRNPHKEYQMTLYHEGICAVCGRKLINPKSIEGGIGPKCFKRVRHDQHI